MRAREPLLYQHYIGQYRGAEPLPGDPPVTPHPLGTPPGPQSLTGLLLRSVEEAAVQQRLRRQRLRDGDSGGQPGQGGDPRDWGGEYLSMAWQDGGVNTSLSPPFQMRRGTPHRTPGCLTRLNGRCCGRNSPAACTSASWTGRTGTLTTGDTPVGFWRGAGGGGRYLGPAAEFPSCHFPPPSKPGG